MTVAWSVVRSWRGGMARRGIDELSTSREIARQRLSRVIKRSAPGFRVL